MALNDDRKKKPQDPALAALQAGYAPVRQGYDAANAQVQSLTAKRDALAGVVKPDLVIPRNEFAPVTQVSDTPGGVSALQAVTGQLGQATQARDAYIPKLNQAAQGFRQYTDQTNANTLLRNVGVAPMPLPTPSAPAAPVRNPAGRVPAAGAPAPAGGVAASAAGVIPAPGFANVQGAARNGFSVNLGAGNVGGGGPVPQSVASSVTNGVPTYDNASIARLNARNGVAAPTSTGASLPLPTAYPAAPVATPNLAVNVPRPVAADPYTPREANGDLKRIADTIDTELFRNSFAADRGSRSAREAQAQMLGTLAALGGKRLDVAANVASGDRDTAARYDLTGMDETGQNQRALLGDQGQTTRTGMEQEGADRRQYLQTLAEMGKPETYTDASGNVLRVSGTSATPVTGPDGKPVKAPMTKADGMVTPAVEFQGNIEQLKALQESLGVMPAQGDNDPRVQQVAALQARNAQLAGGGQTATNPKTGERQRYNPQTQQWEPIK